MANGIPDYPPENIEFESSYDDVTCPTCGWDTEEAKQDPRSSFQAGIMLAYQVEDAGYQVMAGMKSVTIYFRCPGKLAYSVPVNPEFPDSAHMTEERPCGTHFSIDEEVTYMGGMS